MLTAEVTEPIPPTERSRREAAKGAALLGAVVLGTTFGVTRSWLAAGASAVLTFGAVFALNRKKNRP